MYLGWPITPVQKRSVATPFLFCGHPSRVGNRYNTNPINPIMVPDLNDPTKKEKLHQNEVQEKVRAFRRETKSRRGDQHPKGSKHWKVKSGVGLGNSLQVQNSCV